MLRLPCLTENNNLTTAIRMHFPFRKKGNQMLTRFLHQDLLYAFRQLSKSLSFTLATVLTLALGIGANLTVFLLLYGVLFRPLPFPHPHQLVRIERSYPDGEIGPVQTGTMALFMRRTAHVFEYAAAYDYIAANTNLVQAGEAVPLKTRRATVDFFRVFDVPPVIGRGFEVADMVPNAAGVVVVSDPLWRQRFSADPHILGRSIVLGNRPFTVVGVASPALRLESNVDVWMPLPIVENPNDQNHDLNFVARLRPGVTREQATADLKNVYLQLKVTYPRLWQQSESPRVLDYHDSFVGDIKPALRILMGAVALVLVIVSANILCLLLTRSIGRRREMSLRAALGASQWRILRQLLAENAVLCIAGGGAAIFFAANAAPALMRLSPLELPAFASLEIGTPGLCFAAALTLACALLFSLVPLFESRGVAMNESLRINTTQIAQGRHLAQKALVVSEVAVSLMLMVAAGLLLSSFWKLLHTPTGFDPTNVVTFKNAFANEQVPTSAALNQHVQQVVARLEAIPGVESAAAAANLPTQLVADLPFDILGRGADRRDAGGDEKYVPVSDHYFSTLQVPLVSGRIFAQSESAPVIIVNQQFARLYFKGENPISQHLRIGAMMGPEFADSVREIVGVVGDVKQTGLDQPTPAVMYVPLAQVPDNEEQLSNGLLGTSWMVRTRSGQVDVPGPARRIFMDDAHTPLLSVESLTQVISASLAQQRFNMVLLSCFGIISLVLGAAGLYGVLSFAVARQTKEIGLRMAVGAQREDIVRMVLKDASVLIVAGLLVGVTASIAGARLLQSLVYGIKPRDPYTMLAMSLLLLLTGFFAAWWPARRAASTEPMIALRND
jgi:predicted permease